MKLHALYSHMILKESDDYVLWRLFVIEYFVYMRE